MEESQKPQISKEDLTTMQNYKKTMDGLVIQIGNIEFRKARLVGTLNEYNIASEKFINELVTKYGFPKDRKLVIDENGFVTFEGQETQVIKEPN